MFPPCRSTGHTLFELLCCTRIVVKAEEVGWMASQCFIRPKLSWLTRCCTDICPPSKLTAMVNCDPASNGVSVVAVMAYDKFLLASSKSTFWTVISVGASGQIDQLADWPLDEREVKERRQKKSTMIVDDRMVVVCVCVCVCRVIGEYVEGGMNEWMRDAKGIESNRIEWNRKSGNKITLPHSSRFNWGKAPPQERGE